MRQQVWGPGRAGFPQIGQQGPGLGTQALWQGRGLGLGHRGGPGFQAAAGGPGAAGDEVAQGLAQRILVVVGQPAEQGHQFRAEAGDGIQHRLDAAQAHRRGGLDRGQEIAGHHLAAYRDLHQAAHLGGDGQVRGQAIGQGPVQGQGHGDFPEIGDLWRRFIWGGRWRHSWGEK